MHTTCLTEFHSIRPIHESVQQKTLDWILKAHTQAEALSKGWDIDSEESQAFEKSIKDRLLRVGCKLDHITKRGHVIDDFLHQNWDKMKIYVLDIVHTELCSLHTNPSNHSADQLVSQSLFADGFIKYTAKKHLDSPHIKVLSIHEEIISHSTEAMKWNLADCGFQILLAKEVPVLITKALQMYLENLCAKASLKPEEVLKNAHFAIHPGGPKIIKYIQQYFRLEDEQIEKSKLILKQFGNMSSATLPNIWDAILQDPKVDSGTWIVSMAFGPGLSICGALMQKG